ncbi:MAG: helix-turn-helix domain-containing protein [Treponema sp.]|jgi:transcriptional regulator with XRE-family HTH domain|nr:helix-turn-helix domain-containing protein [Treponema sp.]
MTDLRKVLAFNMKLNRKNLGLSQAKLAELVNVSDNHIALIETGRRFPSITMLESLATAMKIDILELFSIKSIELSTKKGLKDAILADIDHILSHRLLEEG